MSYSAANWHLVIELWSTCKESTHLMAPRQEEVVKVLWPVEAAQAEVKALPVGAVQFLLERHL